MDDFVIKFSASNEFIERLSNSEEKLSMTETMLVINNLLKQSDLIVSIESMLYIQMIGGWEFTILVNGGNYYRNLLVNGCKDITIPFMVDGVSYEIDISSGYVYTHI